MEQPLLVIEIGGSLHLLGDGSPDVIAVHHGDAQPRPGDEGVGGLPAPSRLPLIPLSLNLLPIISSMLLLITSE
ncbi:MAG: hypothetical protein WBH57_06150 [Anaerolineae bacterium]